MVNSPSRSIFFDRTDNRLALLTSRPNQLHIDPDRYINHFSSNKSLLIFILQGIFCMRAGRENQLTVAQYEERVTNLYKAVTQINLLYGGQLFPVSSYLKQPTSYIN